MTYKAILFDLDDTLYDLRAYWTGRLHEVFDTLLERYPQFERAPLLQRAIAEKVYIDRLPAFLRSLGVEDEAFIVSAHAAYGRDWFGRLALFDDAALVLRELRQHFQLGLVTNGPVRMQRPKIEQFRLADQLDLLIVSEEVGVAKPNPAIFQLALDHFGIQPHEALFVGDSPEFDLRGAAAARMPVIWMNPRRETLPSDVPPPLTQIEQLSELLPLLGLA